MQKPPDGVRVFLSKGHEDFFQNRYSGMGTVWLWASQDDGRLMVYAVDREDGVAHPAKPMAVYAAGAWVSAKGWDLRDYTAGGD